MGVTVLPDAATMVRNIWVRKCDYEDVRAFILELMVCAKADATWWLNTAHVFNRSGVQLLRRHGYLDIIVDSVPMVRCDTQHEALHEAFLMFGPPQDRPAWTKRLTYELTLMGNDPHQPTTER